MNNLLSLMTFLPMVGALVILILKASPLQAAHLYRWVALVFTGLPLVLAGYLWMAFNPQKVASKK